MAKTYHPKYYAEPVKGTGHTYINPKTGEKKTCKGVAWYLDFKNAEGKRERKKVHEGLCTCPPRHKGTCPHERLAQEALAAVLNAPAPIEETLAEAAKDRSIANFANRHLHKVELGNKHCGRNKQNVRLSIDTFVEFCDRYGLEYLDEIKRTHIEDFRDELAARRKANGDPYKSRTTNRYLCDVRAMLYKALDQELIDKNPAASKGRNDDLFLPEDDSKPMTIFTQEELQILFSLDEEALKKLFTKNYRVVREMMIVFYHTGLRLGELTNLTFHQVRYNRIYIEPHDGWKPKWGIRRQVPIDEKVAELIRARREEFPAAKYVFETSAGTRFEEKNVRDDFKKLFDSLGIVGDTGEGVSTHCFRHTYATTCLNDDVPITTVSLWLGHQNIQMTMRYFHRIKALTDSQIKKVKFVG